MDRRTVLAGVGSAVVAAALPPAAKAAARNEDAQLRALLDTIFNERIDHRPQEATTLGLDTGARAVLKARLDDTTPDARAVEQARLASEQARLHAIVRAKLSPASQIDYDVVDYGLSRAVEAGRRFPYGSTGGRFAPYEVSQLTGPYRDVPDFLDSEHRIASASDAEAWLARLNVFARAIDMSTERQRADARKSVFAPDYILDTTIGQMRGLRDRPPAETVLVSSLVAKAKTAGLSGDFGARAEAIVTRAINPALDRQLDLVSGLRGKAVHDAGVWRLPDGDGYYAAALAAATTAALTPEEVHRMGLDQVAEISGRIDAILTAQGMTTGTVGERLVALNQRPDQLFANTDEGRAALVATLNTQIAAMLKRLPEAFSTLPKAAVEARRVPPLIQAGAPGGYYNAASLDGSRPATYYINLRDTFDRPKFGLATLTHHEAVPGHHLQISLAQESTAIPLLRRRSNFSAYTEGWALYAEQLADEMGMYDGDPLGRVGYLQSFLFRATRLVVDTGMHARRWSREQATDYLIATTGIARGRSQGEIDRYTVWPGQACSYKIGHTRWAALRDRAKAALGDRFDLRRFHDVLLQGAMPLTILETVIDRDIAAAQNPGAANPA